MSLASGSSYYVDRKWWYGSPHTRRAALLEVEAVVHNDERVVTTDSPPERNSNSPMPPHAAVAAGILLTTSGLLMAGSGFVTLFYQPGFAQGDADRGHDLVERGGGCGDHRPGPVWHVLSPCAGVTSQLAEPQASPDGQVPLGAESCRVAHKERATRGGREEAL